MNPSAKEVEHARFRPQYEIFGPDAQPWDKMDPAIPKYEQYPPQR
jgi:hypothetical protein